MTNPTNSIQITLGDTVVRAGSDLQTIAQYPARLTMLALLMFPGVVGVSVCAVWENRAACGCVWDDAEQAKKFVRQCSKDNGLTLAEDTAYAYMYNSTGSVSLR
jgi:hypothetical protein